MKKAQMTLTWFPWILRIIFLTIIIFSITTFVKKYADARIDISSIHANILNYHILLDKSLLVSDPVTQRIYPLHFQPSLPQTLNPSAQYPEDHAAAKLTTEDQQHTVYYQKNTYEHIQQSPLFRKNYHHIITHYPALINNQPTKVSIDIFTHT